MQLVITINLDNTAFYDGNLFNPEIEIVRILQDFCRNMYITGMDKAILSDINGNIVGKTILRKKNR